MPDRTDGVIALPADLTEWLIGRAHAHHGGSYAAALEQVLRQVKAREDGVAFAAEHVDAPADPWAGITAEARQRRGR